MSTGFLFLVQFTVLAYALVAGVFLAFSDFIMRSLRLTSGHGGVEAMQAINREVFRWVFMVLFIGLAPLSLFIAVYAIFFIGQLPGVLLALSGLTYVLGCFAVTICFNVPMNERLAEMGIPSESTRDYWEGTYLPRWTFWNSVRTVASALAATLLLLGLVSLAQNQIAAV